MMSSSSGGETWEGVRSRAGSVDARRVSRLSQCSLASLQLLQALDAQEQRRFSQVSHDSSIQLLSGSEYADQRLSRLSQGSLGSLQLFNTSLESQENLRLHRLSQGSITSSLFTEDMMDPDKQKRLSQCSTLSLQLLRALPTVEDEGRFNVEGEHLAMVSPYSDTLGSKGSYLPLLKVADTTLYF